MTTQMMPIRVMVVDDQPVVRSGLAAFLESFDDLQMVAEAGDGARAVRLCARYQPDVVLMDLAMPVMDGAEATRQIRKHYPHIQVLALTSFKEDDLVQRVLQAGAIGYLLKHVEAEDLASAIRAAYAGHPTLSPEATEALIRKATQASEPEIGTNLTHRERDVLTYMVDGLNNNTIAKEMVVSRSTIKFHVSNLLAKLHAANRMEAISIALRNHLVGEASAHEEIGATEERVYRKAPKADSNKRATTPLTRETVHLTSLTTQPTADTAVAKGR